MSVRVNGIISDNISDKFYISYGITGKREISMAMYDVGKVKLGGFFSKSVKVLYEQKFDGASMDGDLNTIVMMLEDGGELGKISYAMKGTNCKITVFAIHDWSTPTYAKNLLKKFLTVVKKAGVKHIEGEIYAKDNTTFDQIHLLKSIGFKVEAGSSVTGYQAYYIRKNL